MRRLKQLWQNIRAFHFEKTCFWGAFVFGVGVAGELWYITTKDGNRMHHFFHLGFLEMHSEEHSQKAVVLSLTILFFSLKLGTLHHLERSLY